jgi:capsular polysaccharide transport system ATP-binding protein
MIQLLDVAKSYTKGRSVAKVLFSPSSIAMPLDCRIGVLGGKGAGKTTLLQMLAGNVPPDRGCILMPENIAPVANSGRLLYPQLSIADNAQFIARIYGVNVERLLMAMAAFQASEFNLRQPVRLQSTDSRRGLETAMITVLPFDCYLYDDIGHLEPQLLERCFEAAYQRHATAVFSTADPRLVQRFAEFVIVIKGTGLYPFQDAEAAVDFFKTEIAPDRN